jgi:hypothetical protein
VCSSQLLLCGAHRCCCTGHGALVPQPWSAMSVVRAPPPLAGGYSDHWLPGSRDQRGRMPLRCVCGWGATAMGQLVSMLSVCFYRNGVFGTCLVWAKSQQPADHTLSILALLHCVPRRHQQGSRRAVQRPAYRGGAALCGQPWCTAELPVCGMTISGKFSAMADVASAQQHVRKPPLLP